MSGGGAESIPGRFMLREATEADFETLSSWFTDRRSTVDWGGPSFRFPFTRETFLEDCRWREMSSFCLVDDAGALVGFGQFYDRNGRINLARLVACPGRRRQGIGTLLIRELMDRGAEMLGLEEFSLYVYKHNEAAYRCYRSLGFREQEYPEDGPLAGECHYMTRPVTLSGSPIQQQEGTQ